MSKVPKSVLSYQILAPPTYLVFLAGRTKKKIIPSDFDGTLKITVGISMSDFGKTVGTSEETKQKMAFGYRNLQKNVFN